MASTGSTQHDQVGSRKLHAEETDLNGSLQPQNVVDVVVFGRRLRALRIIAGYDRAADLTATLRSRYGVEVSDRTLYAIERGEQMPTVDLYVAVICELDAPDDYFYEAVRSDVADRMRRRVHRRAGDA